MSDHFLNPALLHHACAALSRAAVRQKFAFVPPPDPAAGGMPPGGMPPGGMPPGGMPPGIDPGAAGGPPPPPDPAAAGVGGNPGGGLDVIQLRQVLGEFLGAGGQGGGAAGAGIKPKIDVNVELMQIKNMLAKLVDALGVPMPAQDMAATPEKLTAMAQGQPAGTASPDAQSGGAAIPPIQPVAPFGGGAPPGAPPKVAAEQGVAFSTAGLAQVTSAAEAARRIYAKRRAN